MMLTQPYAILGGYRACLRLAADSSRMQLDRRHDRGEQAEGGDRQISVRFGKHLAALFGAGPVRAADAGSLNSAYRLLTVSV